MAMSISRPNPYPINRIPLPTLNQRIRCGLFIKSTRPTFRVPSSAFWLPNAGINSNKISSIASILPGGSWWNLSDFDEEKSQEAKPVTLWTALGRMWTLIGDEQWIVCLGLGGLIVAAVSEISMPSILAASIFSAESRAAAEFHRNARLLILLCITSGICSGLRSCCFGIANTILVKRFRETLYLALVFQDVSFFDTETVGGLTSRLGADCQHLSRVIGNDVHLILRNLLLH